MKLEVLVATMGQSDCSLAEKMNIGSHAVIANQCGRWGYEENASGTVRMLSTDTVGVGVNRNLALQLSKADILLFADDDVSYYDGALSGVINAFQELPDADVIFFGIDMTRNGEVFDKRRNQKKRLHIWNSLRYGAARMAVRREAVLKNRLAFSTLFGGGCRYCSGEDTIFIADSIRAGLHVYSHDLVLGTCAKDSSTWFAGFDEKFFFDKGAMLACAFPKTKHLIKWYFMRRFLKKQGVSAKMVIKNINKGIRAFPKLQSYEEVMQLGSR